MSHFIKTILVDLTPMLPGGENGGAKVFILELLSRLAEIAPTTNFVLLVQSAVYDELKYMERPNMSRCVIIRPAGKKSFFARGVGYIFRKLPSIPQRFSLIGYQMQAHLRRHAARSTLKRIQADLIFCPFTAPTYAIPGIPTVCTIYDLQFKAYPSFFDAADVANRSHAFTEACRRAAKLVAISDYSRQTALQHGRLKPEQIETIHLQMANRMVDGVEKDSNILTNLDLDAQQYLLYPANFWLHKNHEMLLTAFNLACQHPNFPKNMKLVCTGASGERQKWLQNAAKHMRLETRVLFLSYLTNEALATLMSNCAGLIFPSLYEGFGLPLLEAMAAGVPVACSNTTSLPEIADSAAIFFDPRIPTQIAEAMVTLVSDKNRRERLIKAGHERVHLFSDAKRMASEYWRVFETACASQGV